jgi:CBS domain-containing protein
MKVRDVMKTSVITVASSMLLRDLWKLIIKKRINSVLVVDKKGNLEGIVVREDLLAMIFPKYDEFISDFESAADFNEMESHVRTIGNKKASDVMKTKLIFAHEDTELIRALSRMIVHHVEQLPVVTKNEKVIGIVSKNDIFSSLFRTRANRSSKH